MALTTVILIVNGFSIRARLVRDRIAHDLSVQNLRFNALLADMPLGVCMFDCNGFLTVSNERYLRMHGLPAASAASGTSVREIVQYSKASGAFPGDVDSYCKELSEALGRGELVRHLTDLNDGRVIASLSQPIGDGGWISIYEDITEQQLAKVRLEQTRKFLDSIVENVPAPIVVKEPEKGTFVLVNHAYEKFIGLPRERLMGKTVYDVFPPKDAELIATYDNEAIKFSERVISAELSVETPINGSRVVTTTRLVVLDENDKPHFVIAIINDVTEKRKAEARIAYMAHHDPITGLLNRARFAERLEGALACAEQNTHLAVLFIDLDHFKHVNDTLGHLIGDELLRAVADRLRGCIQEIDAVARLGGSDAANWPDDIRIAVNLSPAQFRSQSLAQVVINSLATSGIAPSRLELEITEELLLGHNRDNLSMLEQLRKIGVQIVMDDFGIGYSSLNYLRLFPFDKIKIDRSFINEEDDLSLAIVQAVTSLARVLRVPVTAEGIETREQLDFIRAAGCTEFQGYLFSTPKPSAEIVAFLRGSAQMAANAA